MHLRFLTLLAMLAGCTQYNLKGTKEVEDATDEPDEQDTALPTDTGEAPEPGDCSEFEAPDSWEASVDESCLREPEHTVGSFDPVVEWQWTSNPFVSGYHQIMSTPAVGNLDDDNGDGVVNADDIPEVVFTSFSGGSYQSPGTLTAVRGDGSVTLWSITEAGGHRFYSAGGVAIGDLEGDGSPDVCAAGVDAAVVCVEADGSFKWAAGTATEAYGCPAIADMDGDGLAEVVFGAQVFDHAGNLLGHGAHGTGSRSMSFPVDMDGDGIMEVVAGNAVYAMDGAVVWYDGGVDGVPAVGDFDGDGDPEVVRVASGQVILTDGDGTTIWTTTLPGGGTGGAPTVADFDGDGLPEIGVAGRSTYTVFDSDGTELWSNETRDYSSSMTGSSVFDFEGDGVAEVVYADETTLWIYSGPDGSVLLEEGGHASGTLFEYPLIADVDNDGSTEIIIASNNYTFSGWNGITVIGDLNDSWAPARPVWNQFAYHITNVNDDSSIPASPEPNWASWNNFRAAGSPEGPPTWQVDMGFGAQNLCLEECHEARVHFYLGVENTGLVGAEDVLFQLVRDFDGARDVYHEETLPRIGSGGSMILGPFVMEYTDWGLADLEAILTPVDERDECSLGNNVLELGAWPCP